MGDMYWESDRRDDAPSPEIIYRRMVANADSLESDIKTRSWNKPQRAEAAVRVTLMRHCASKYAKDHGIIVAAITQQSEPSP